MSEDDEISLAKRLPDGARRALMAMTDDFVLPGRNTFNANGAGNLRFYARAYGGLVEDRIAKGRAAFRLTPLGERIKARLSAMTIPPEVTEREAVARVTHYLSQWEDTPTDNAIVVDDQDDESPTVGDLRAILARQSTPSPDVMAERLTLWLYRREGGVAFDALRRVDQWAWAKQGRDGIEAALGQPLSLPPADQKK